MISFFLGGNVLLIGWNIIAELIINVILPVMFGSFIGHKFSEQLASRKNKLTSMTQVMILAFIYYGLSIQYEQILKEPLFILQSTAILMGLHLLLLLLAHGSGRLLGFSHPQRISLVFASGQKTLPVSILIATQVFESDGAVFVFVIYYLCQLYIDGFIANRYAAQGSKNPEIS